MQYYLMKTLAACCLIIAMILAGCRQRPRQTELEYEAASAIRKFLALHEARFPDIAITNVAQAFAQMDLSKAHRMHPYILQSEFRKFGKYAGFKNSIYEKYLILPAGHRPRDVQGEIAFLNAEPFPNSDGELGRWVVFQVEKGYENCRKDWIEERQVQQIFKESGMTIPNPVPMPPPPKPEFEDEPEPRTLTERVRITLDGIGQSLGWGKGHALTVTALGLVLSLLTGIFLFIWVGRRGRH